MFQVKHWKTTKNRVKQRKHQVKENMHGNKQRITSEKCNSKSKPLSGRGGRGRFNNQGRFNQRREITELEKLQCSLKFHSHDAKSEEKDNKIPTCAKVHEDICLKIRDKVDKYPDDVTETLKNLDNINLIAKMLRRLIANLPDGASEEQTKFEQETLNVTFKVQLNT